MRARNVLVFSSIALSFLAAACSGDDSSNPLDGSVDSASPNGDSAPPSNDAGVKDGAVTPDATSNLDGSSGQDGSSTADGSPTADASDANAPTDGGPDGTAVGDGGDSGQGTDASDGGDSGQGQQLVTTLGAGDSPIAVTINQGTAIGEGALNGATPSTLTNVAADPNNKETISSATNPFQSAGTVPDTAAGFCEYPADGGAPKRISYVTGAKFEGAGDAGATDGSTASDPMVPMAPFYFPLTYTTTLTPNGNAFGGKSPVIGLFDWRPKDIDEALVVAESDDDGKTWYFMQTVLELNPDYTNPISGGYSATSTDTGCPSAITATNANFTSANGSTADDGWGHAAIIQLPGVGNAKTGQFLYMLDRNPNNIPGTSNSIVDNAPLHAINLTSASNKFPIWNTNNTNPGANDIKSISSAITNTPDAGAPVAVRDTVGLLNPDGIMAVFPTAPNAAAGSPVTVLYVQKILGGDNTGSTAMPVAQQCTKAPFSGKTNHDISNVRMATTTDGIHFTDLGVVLGLNDPTTVDYNKTRWVSPRGTLIDIHGDGSVWGLYFSGGNCLDGDSDAFHFIGYAESTDKMHWTVYNDINSPIASINTITTKNQAGGATVTIPANAPVFPTQRWFAQRLYAPTAVQIDPTHLSLTFAGYGVQSPNADLLNYRQIGNVVLTVSKALPPGTPNNINAH